MDEGDIAQRSIDTMLQAQIANTIRQGSAHGTGPDDCLRCGAWNDRAAQGYGTCTDCFEEVMADMNSKQ